MARPTILQHPLYGQFVDRYCADPLRFAVEVCALEPSADQIDLFNAVAAPTARVSVVSGTTTGKTAAFGRIALWHLLCHPYAVVEGKIEIGSNAYIGAPRIQQVSDGVWKEMQDAKLAIANNSEFDWLDGYFDITKTRVTVRGYEDQWFIAQMALQAGQSVGIAGKHRFWQMVIGDEAAGISDDHFKVINGTQTQGGNRTILASQGVRNAGFFYETHHNLNSVNGGAWTALRFDSERSPFVTDETLREREQECGGRDTIEYKIRVRGLFAEDTSSVLLSRSEVEGIFGSQPLVLTDEAFGYILSVDVGAGEYRDDSVVSVARVIGNGDFGDDARRVEVFKIPLASNSKNEIDLAGEVIAIYGQFTNATLMIDHGGIGASVCRLVEREGIPVMKIDWGKPCFKKAYKDRFYNQRACANVRLRDAIRQGRFRVTASMDKRLREKILLQGSRLPYHFAEAGGLRYVMAKKEDMAREGIKSPDIWDTFAFLFLEDAYYMPTGSTAIAIGSRREQARSEAEKEWADADQN